MAARCAAISAHALAACRRQTLLPATCSALVDDAVYYMQLSEAAYGWRGALVLGTQGGAGSGAHTAADAMGALMSGGDAAVFALRAGLPREQVLYRSNEDEVHEPMHWLVVDHDRKEFVVGACRAATRGALAGAPTPPRPPQWPAAPSTWTTRCWT